MLSTLLVLAAFSAPPHDIRAWLHQDAPKPEKPGVAVEAGQNDSCRWANDRECDEPGIGTGACEAGTDYSDCRRIMEGAEDDSCEWANDGECDEPGLGTGACTQGTDQTDCRGMEHLRFRTDACATAFDGVCNEPEGGDGTCEARTDRADCVGRERPLTINDHFFGHDDRVIHDQSVFPWNVVGEITFDIGGQCTATLIAPDVLVSALHCIIEEGVIDSAGVFNVGEHSARIIDHYYDPSWDNDAESENGERDGRDWVLLRLDQPLGEELGYVGVAAPDDLLERELYQGGYSWDTGAHLSGNVRCRAVEIHPESDTMAHECDTTRGDSGSPFLVRDGEFWLLVATDSRFESNKAGPMRYIAALSSAWIEHYDAFVAGELSSRPPPVEGKPGGKLPGKDE